MSTTEPGRTMRAGGNPLPAGLRSDPPTPRGPLFRRVLDDKGNGAGTTEATADYSITPASFFVAPELFDVVITRLVVSLRDTAKWKSPGYGSADPLTNGVVVRYTDTAGGQWDVTDNRPVRILSDWGTMLTWGASSKIEDVGDKHVGLGVVDFWATGSCFHLPRGARFEVVCSDDLSHLEHHEFSVLGYGIA